MRRVGVEKRQNTAYILKVFIPWILFDILVAAIILRSVLGSIQKNEIICFTTYFFILILGISVILWSEVSRRNRLFQANSPDLLIASSGSPVGPHFLNRASKQIVSALVPVWKPYETAQKATYYCYFGQFDSARQELEKIQWDKFPPMVRADKAFVEALFAYLEKKDFTQGLELSREAMRLHQLSEFIPGKPIFYSKYVTLVEIGQALNGDSSEQLRKSLEKKARRSPLVSRLLVAWALENTYRRMGEVQKAIAVRAFLMKTAPYCKAFSRDAAAGI
jgi:hypothetical protein